MIPTAVFISGTGSNLAALIQHTRAPDHPAEICVVFANREAPGLAHARAAGIPTVVLSHRDFPSRSTYDQAIVDALRPFGVRWICLAGYMRLVSHTLINAFEGRVLNIHPALLPSFPGLHAQKQALEYGVKLTGVTIHYVDTGMDTGPIIAQQAVPVLPDDTEDSLKARILEVEHRLYAQTLRQVLSLAPDGPHPRP